ncbi:MAG: phosphoribosyl-ATP diphosphatase [Candidatus Melainabacteria bacterium]
MIIPSIDLMDGKAVQLRQGKDRVLTSDRDPIALAQEFNRYGEIAVIDLDAAMGRGDNLSLIKDICRVADVRAGGGIRDKERGRALLRAGAQRIIIGTAATPEFLAQFPAERVMVAIDHRNGEVVDHGWTQGTGENVTDRATRLAPYCGGYLCTNVADEGMMSGMDVAVLTDLQKKLPHPVTVAGGAKDTDDVIAVSRAGLDIQVGMALYTGKIDPVQAVIGSLDFEKCPQMPTIVQDDAGQVLMLAYSTPESLEIAMREGTGTYFSRSRQGLWEKGKTSGHTQTLLSVRPDCDRDTLLFRVKQAGPACHTNAYSCFGYNHKARQFSLPALFDTLRERKATLPEGSFSAKLFSNREFLFRKVMEEAFEVTQAKNREEYTWEISDALFFLSTVAVDEGLNWADIEAELGGRSR